MRAPLDEMRIRTAQSDSQYTGPEIKNRLKTNASPIGGSFGKGVRSSGTKPHQGWDLYAEIGTFVYTIGPGVVVFSEHPKDSKYGLQICVRLDEAPFCSVDAVLPAVPKFAFYAHMQRSFVKAGVRVSEDKPIGTTGNSGNARGLPPHLHFEIRTTARLGKGLKGRIDPGEVLGYSYYGCQP